MRDEEEKILVYDYLIVTLDRANIGTGRANLLEKGGLVMAQSGTTVPLQARAVPRFWSPRLNFFSFL